MFTPMSASVKIMESDARSYAVAASTGSSTEYARVLTGLETWFTLPSKPGEPAPPRYKMAVVTWIAVFPLASAIFAVTQPLLGGLPVVLCTLAFTLIMVTTMTYVVMPRMTRLFSFWLYPDD